jgi:hypothetical protein
VATDQIIDIVPSKFNAYFRNCTYSNHKILEKQSQKAKNRERNTDWSACSIPVSYLFKVYEGNYVSFMKYELKNRYIFVKHNHIILLRNVYAFPSKKATVRPPLQKL